MNIDPDYFEMARDGTLPEHFNQTVAHAAAIHIAPLFKRARKGMLPSDFSQWDLAEWSGWTVAYEDALNGHLPKEFDRWELADKNGRTVAHIAACWGHLPEGFDRWELADKRGWTVAHEAARSGCLPEGFDQWDLADNSGETVRQIMLKYDEDRIRHRAEAETASLREALDRVYDAAFSECVARLREKSKARWPGLWAAAGAQED